MDNLDTAWLETFGIADRLGTPDLALGRDSVTGVPHASAMRVAFQQRQVDGFLSVDGVPTVAFASRNELNFDEIDRLHKALWNQGLASVLLVHLPAEVRVYSLWQRPLATNNTLGESDRRLIETLKLATDAIRLRRLVPSVESGRYFEEHEPSFDGKSRLDATLLANLREALKRLREEGLPDDNARALILQIIFIAYLEDREIIDAHDFEAGLNTEQRRLVDVLGTRDPRLLERLFTYLRRTFNGDVFFAPGVFETSPHRTTLEPRHLDPIADFREGQYEMETGQGQFWPYDFQFIPVELISAIYDRFLNEDNKSRKESGAYFTPPFLADLVVDQVWNALDPNTRANSFSVLDPACGSAIFLVRMFQKMIEEYKCNHEGAAPNWWDLRKYLVRLHGWDIDESAVRIGVFSLYVALLEQVHPPAIRALEAEGKFLPRLLGKTLCCRDFFEERVPERRFNVIIGNPPWVSRKSKGTETALDWCSQRKLPVPNKEIAWAFLWKAAEHLAPNGRIALLLPAMGILLNHSTEVCQARRTWLEGADVLKIINFADACFQLFDGAKRPTILALYGLRNQAGREYEIEYWVPKAHRLLSATRLIIVPTVDRSSVRMTEVRRDPAIWKKRMWATNRDLKLLAWLSDLPKLSGILSTYARSKKRTTLESRWLIGQGFKPFNEKSTSIHHDFTFETAVTDYPFLAASQFTPWTIRTVTASPWPDARVHRAGFVDGFKEPHILIPQGVIRKQGRLRAAYVEQSLCFKHSIQAIRFPRGEERKAKILTAVLNSSLAAWYYFHTSANFGADRAKVHEKQLLELPFPDVEDMPNGQTARRAADSIVGIVDNMLARRGPNAVDEYVEQVDDLVFDYYGLSKSERTLVTDTLCTIIPSVQPPKNKITRLMKESKPKDRINYTRILLDALGEWMRPGTEVMARLMEGASEAAVIELRLGSKRVDLQVEPQSGELETALRAIRDHLPLTMSRNLEVHPDLKVFIDDSLYVVKPLSIRYWLPSTALNDADDIAADLLASEARAAGEGWS